MHNFLMWLAYGLILSGMAGISGAIGFARAMGKKAPKPEPDSADDGPEVDLIRTQLNMTVPNGPLYWRDPGTGRVLPRPMSILEVMERYDYTKKS